MSSGSEQSALVAVAAVVICVPIMLWSMRATWRWKPQSTGILGAAERLRRWTLLIGVPIVIAVLLGSVWEFLSSGA